MDIGMTSHFMLILFVIGSSTSIGIQISTHVNSQVFDKSFAVLVIFGIIEFLDVSKIIMCKCDWCASTFWIKQKEIVYLR